MNKNVLSNVRVLGVVALIAIGVLFLWAKTNESSSQKWILDSAIKSTDLLKPMESSGELLLRNQGNGAVFLSAEETRLFFTENLKDWKAEDKAPKEVPVPKLTLYINLADNFKVHFYGSETELAMIQNNNHYRYFKIPKGTYEKMAFDYSIRSYLVPEPLIEAIGEGQLTKLESVNDTPNHVNYKAVQVGNFQFYFYKRSGKFYVEAPYTFIKELKKDVYEQAIAAIPQ